MPTRAALHYPQAFVVVGDSNGHVGLGVKCAKEVATAIRGAIIMAKMSCVPVRRGYWGNKIGKVHTVPTKITGELRLSEVDGLLAGGNYANALRKSAQCDQKGFNTAAHASTCGYWTGQLNQHRCSQDAEYCRCMPALAISLPAGKCGSVSIRLVPAPRGAGIVAARTPKKVLQMAGIEDCYTSSTGCRKTLGNFVKATFNALALTYGFLSPDLWRETKYTKSPLQVCWGEGISESVEVG